MIIQTLAVGELAVNCYIVRADENAPAVVIDPGAEADRILEALHGESPAAILLTHGHFDHIGALDQLPAVPTYIHRADAEMLGDETKNGSLSLGFFTRCRRECISVDEGTQLELAGLHFTVMHTPGHSAGSVTWQVQDVLFTGDTLFHRGYGRTDLYGGSFGQLRQSLRRLLTLQKNYTFYPGHGINATLDMERRV